MIMVTKRTVLVIAIGAVLALAAGCSSYRPRPVDITKGEYYEDTEYKKLSKKDKEAYCKALAAELAGASGPIEEGGGGARPEQGQDKEPDEGSPRGREGLHGLQRRRSTSSRSSSRTLSQLPKTWKLQSGDCLWTLASYEEIYKDPLKWPRIWRSNKELIEDPDWVLAGWEVTIPREYPYAYKVDQDEWLGKIAGYWEIYGDYRKWPLIFEANRDRIKDPDLIFPNQELVIPRQDTLQ